MISRDNGSTPVPAAINLSDVLRGVLHRKVMIIGMTLLFFAGSLAYVNYTKPMYSSEAKILIQNMETPFDRVQAQDTQRSEAGVDDRIVASQIAVLQSSDLGRRVIDELNLASKPEFNSLLAGLGPVSRLKLALGFGEDPRLKTPEQRALGRYADELTVYQQPNSNVIAVEFSSTNPETAAAVSNTLSKTYIQWTRESQAQPTERARDWLSAQIDELRQKLARSEEAVEKFRAEAGLLQGATTTLGTQEISELNTQITLARAASTEARARADSIRDLLNSKGSVDASSDVLASAAVQRLKEQRSDAARRLAELSATYLPGHPKMVAAQGEVTSVDRQIRSEALKVVTSLEEQARVADAREKSLRESLDRLKSAEANANIDDVKLKALEREASADRALLETMLSRFAEASSRQDQSAQPGMARIIQSASVPSAPSFPKRGPIVLLLTLAGAALAIGLAFLAELMAAAARLTERLSEQAQPAVAPAPPAYAVSAMPSPAQLVPAAILNAVQPAPAGEPHAAPRVPEVATMPQVETLEEAKDFLLSPAVTPAAAQLAAWSLGQAAGGGVRLALLAVNCEAIAAATASVAVARHFAASGKRVVIADLSNGGSQIEDICGVIRGPGLAELLMGTVDFTKVIGRDLGSTAHILRHGNDWSATTRQLIAQRAESVLAALAQVYDVVIISLGGTVADLPSLVRVCQHVAIIAPEFGSTGDVGSLLPVLTAGAQSTCHVLVGPPQAARAELSLKSA
ncbi:MAG: exopolysaccharide transport family protein [Alphaproteobacteria bacterium]|nr:exopolysaccharide transport family protein [Alphaproteobacteria bacterium]